MPCRSLARFFQGPHDLSSGVCFCGDTILTSHGLWGCSWMTSTFLAGFTWDHPITHVLKVHCILWVLLSIHRCSEVKTVDTRQKWWPHLWTAPIKQWKQCKLRISVNSAQKINTMFLGKSFQYERVMCAVFFCIYNEAPVSCWHEFVTFWFRGPKGWPWR